MVRRSLSCLAAFLVLCSLPATSRGQNAARPHSSSDSTISSPTHREEGEAPLIRFERFGGLSGIHEQWLIFSNGRVTGGEEYEKRVAPEIVASLLAEMRGSGFFEMPETRIPASFCADCFTYRVTAEMQGRLKCLTFPEFSAKADASLVQIKEKLSRLVGR